MQIPSALDSDEEDDDAEDRDEVTADETETGDDDDTDTDGPRRPVKAGTRVRATSNFLFPNRTPAATEAIKRRRNVRSRSLGSAGHPGRWAALLGDEWRKGEGSGQAHADERTSLLDRDEDEGEDNALVEPLVGGIAASPVKLRPPPMSRNKSSIRIGNPGELGPSVAEALEISEDGKVLITYEDLPVDWRNNEHVLTG
jgi:adiponectin receptor